MFSEVPGFTPVSLPGQGLAVGQEAKTVEVRAAAELLGREDGCLVGRWWAGTGRLGWGSRREAPLPRLVGDRR